MSAGWLNRAWRALAGVFGVRRKPPRPPTIDGLPSWARVGKRRRAHVHRIAELLEEWAEEMGVTPRERSRWLKAAWLHDALRDARLPSGLTHGAAAADCAAQGGETDGGVLDAVRYHSVGYAQWDDVGRMLFLADFLEPGRRGGRKQRARLAKRVPQDRDGILRQVVGWQIRMRLRAGRPIDPRTLEFWNSIASH